MKAPKCCVSVLASAPIELDGTDGKSHPFFLAKRLLKVARLSLPAVVLALLPKCPACLAAYVALGTGISLSVAAAALLRSILTAACGAALVAVLVSSFRAMPVKRLIPGSRVH
jgi:hypothetical protein